MKNRTPRCNRCGSHLDFFDQQENFHITSDLGYGTIYDGQSLDLHLCCHCMEELISSCVISPVSGGV